MTADVTGNQHLLTLSCSRKMYRRRSTVRLPQNNNVAVEPILYITLGLWSALKSAVLHFQNFIQARFFTFRQVLKDVFYFRA
jgi:hypothetical protein